MLTPAKKRKRKTDYQRAKAAAWRAFSRYIRRRDCLMTTGSTDHGRCCTCGKVYPYEKLQAGHFIAGRQNGILFEPRAVHAQCVGCNMYGGGQHAKYEAFMVDRYGRDVIESLYVQARQPRKYTVSDLREMCAAWNEAAYYMEEHERLPKEGG